MVLVTRRRRKSKDAKRKSKVDSAILYGVTDSLPNSSAIVELSQVFLDIFHKAQKLLLKLAFGVWDFDILTFTSTRRDCREDYSDLLYFNDNIPSLFICRI